MPLDLTSRAQRYRSAAQVISLLAGVALSASLLLLYLEAIPTLVAKARFSEVFALLSNERIDATVDIALHGYARTAFEISTSYSAHDKNGFRYEREDTSLSATKTIQNSPQMNQLTFAPALLSESSSFTVLWLCGSKRPPAGWGASLPSTPHNTQGAHLFSVCRDAV